MGYCTLHLWNIIVETSLLSLIFFFFFSFGLYKSGHDETWRKGQIQHLFISSDKINLVFILNVNYEMIHYKFNNKIQKIHSSKTQWTNILTDLLFFVLKISSNSQLKFKNTFAKIQNNLKFFFVNKLLLFKHRDWFSILIEKFYLIEII